MLEEKVINLSWNPCLWKDHCQQNFGVKWHYSYLYFGLWFTSTFWFLALSNSIHIHINLSHVRFIQRKVLAYVYWSICILCSIKFWPIDNWYRWMFMFMLSLQWSSWPGHWFKLINVSPFRGRVSITLIFLKCWRNWVTKGWSRRVRVPESYLFKVIKSLW